MITIYRKLRFIVNDDSSWIIIHSELRFIVNYDSSWIKIQGFHTYHYVMKVQKKTIPYTNFDCNNFMLRIYFRNKIIFNSNIYYHLQFTSVKTIGRGISYIVYTLLRSLNIHHYHYTFQQPSFGGVTCYFN